MDNNKNRGHLKLSDPFEGKENHMFARPTERQSIGMGEKFFCDGIDFIASMSSKIRIPRIKF